MRRLWTRLSPRRRADWLAALALALLVTVEWLGVHGFFDEDQSMLQPLAYFGDAQFNDFVVAAARRGDFLPFVSQTLPSLGAPGVASWNDFPLNEDMLFFLCGLLARVVGVFGAINLAFLAACVGAALSLFFVARRFGLQRPGAFLSGALFGLSGFMFHRNIHHFSLSFYFFIPWLVLVAHWVMAPRGLDTRQRQRTAIVTTLITSWSMVYFVFIGAQVLALAFASRFARFGKAQRKWAFILAGVGFLGVFSMQADSLWGLLTRGRNTHAFWRSPKDVEQFALKPINFFTSSHVNRTPIGQFTGNANARQSITSGEAPSPYMGLVGGAFFIGMIGFLIVRLARGKLGLPVTWALMAIYFTLAHGVGGLNSLMGLFGITLFRSVNRASIFVFCFTLLFAAWAYGRMTRKWPLPARWAVAVVLAFFGSLEMIPKPVQPGSIAENARLADSDRVLVAEAERVLPQGAKVFALPAEEFPEGSAPGLDSHELFRPYFFANHLVFSFGDVKGRPETAWTNDTSHLPLPQMFQVLREKGFQALYVNLKGYGGPGAVQQFQANGATLIMLAPAQDSAFFRL